MTNNKKNLKQIAMTDFSKDICKIAIKSGWQPLGEKNGIIMFVVNLKDITEIVSPNKDKTVESKSVMVVDPKLSSCGFELMDLKNKKAFCEKLTFPLMKTEKSAKAKKIIAQANEDMTKGDFAAAEKFVEMIDAGNSALAQKVKAGLNLLEAVAPKTLEQQIVEASQTRKNKTTKTKTAPEKTF